MADSRLLSVLERIPMDLSFHLLPWRPLGDIMKVQGTCDHLGPANGSGSKSLSQGVIGATKRRKDAQRSPGYQMNAQGDEDVSFATLATSGQHHGGAEQVCGHLGPGYNHRGQVAETHKGPVAEPRWPQVP